MAFHGDGPSPALLEANRRLYNLRTTGRRQPTPAGNRWPIVGAQSPANGCQEVANGDRAPAGGHPARPASPSVLLYPDLAVAILRQGLSAAGRVWLLLRYLDQDGRGWLSLDQVRRRLTIDRAQLSPPNSSLPAPDPSLRICGRRQLRNLLKGGQGVFWELDSERLWLKSAAKVARALGVRRLSGRPVDLPLEVLLAGIGRVRAHLYASFHSGRRHPNPISRQTLEQITGVPARTQRLYDRRAKVRSQCNIAIGEYYSPGGRISSSEGRSASHCQERAWRHRRALFVLVDRRGRQGPAGRRYLAWRLPNSYQGPHEPRPKGRQKKINRQIDLVTERAQGNGLPAKGRFQASPSLFHPDGRSAGRACGRSRTDIYWPQSGSKAGCRLWGVISGDLSGKRRDPSGRK